MIDFLLALGVLALAAVTILVVAVVMVLHKLNRANQVAAGRPSGAPLSWLVSPAAPPRLHRRLRRAVTTADLSSGTIAPGAFYLREVATEITARAVAVDDWLVAANGLHPQVRRPRLRQLAAEVRDIEHSAGRLHLVSGDWRRRLDEASPAMSSPPAIHERLDAVEAALRELPAAVTTPAPQLPDRHSKVRVRATR